MPLRLFVSLSTLILLLGAIFFAPRPFESVFAQQLSPSAPPNYTTSGPPGTCTPGTLIYTSDNVGMNFCNGSNVFRAIPTFGNIATATTLNNLAYWSNTSGTLSNVGIAFSNTGAANTIVESTSGGGIPVGFMPNSGYAAATTGGSTTTTNKLVKLVSGQFVPATTSDTATMVFMAYAGSSPAGTTTVYTTGQGNCIMEAAAGGTAGDYVVASSTTAATCHDAGASPPTGGWVIGQLSNSPAANGTALVYITSGYYGSSGGGSGVTSVGLSLPASVFTLSGTPVTATGTLTGTFSNQNAGVFFAGPCTGAATTPAMRALCAADLQGITWENSAGNISGSVTVNYSTNASPFYTATLTGAVTSFAVSNAVTGQFYGFDLVQDATGGRAVTFSGFHGAPTIDISAVASTHAHFGCWATAGTTMHCIPALVNVP